MLAIENAEKQLKLKPAAAGSSEERPNPMPDISMCNNHACPLRIGCYRYTAQPSGHWQQWALFQWKTVNGKAECPDYWPVRGTKPRRELA